MPVLRGPRGPHAAGDLRGRRRRIASRTPRAGRSASSRTSTRRSSARRSSSTHRATCARSPSSRRRKLEAVATALARAPPGCARPRGSPTSSSCSTRAATPARASRTATRSSSGCASRRRLCSRSCPGSNRGGAALRRPREERARDRAPRRRRRARGAGRPRPVRAPDRTEPARRRAERGGPRRRGPRSFAMRSAGYARAEGPVPLNAWLHTGGHWHLELVPRLTVFAGLELGAGIYVNSLPPGGGRATPAGQSRLRPRSA